MSKDQNPLNLRAFIKSSGIALRNLSIPPATKTVNMDGEAKITITIEKSPK